MEVIYLLFIFLGTDITCLASKLCANIASAFNLCFIDNFIYLLFGGSEYTGKL